MQSEVSPGSSIFSLTEEPRIPLLELEQRKETITQVIPGEIPLAEREYVRYYLQAASRARVYKREYYRLIEFLRDLGGLRHIIFYFGAFLTSALVKRLLHAKIVNRTYNI